MALTTLKTWLQVSNTLKYLGFTIEASDDGDGYVSYSLPTTGLFFHASELKEAITLTKDLFEAKQAGKALEPIVKRHNEAVAEASEDESSGDYFCKRGCGRRVEQAIEGELICQECWYYEQMSDEERKVNEDVQWMQTHCPVCEKKLDSLNRGPQGYCKPCWEERNDSWCAGCTELLTSENKGGIGAMNQRYCSSCWQAILDREARKQRPL